MDEHLDNELVPVESPDLAITDIVSRGDPDTMLAILEKKAELAPRFKMACDSILASQTYSEDWQEFGDNMCLSSAGAERVGRLFDIKFFEVTDKKEEFTDGKGKGYRYVYGGKACMGNRVIHSTGVFSSRNNFLGSKGGELKPLEDINEESIRMAAYHIFCGNAIKALLGLRGMPKAEWEKVMKKVGRQPSKAGKTSYGQGTKGGTSADDTEYQQELAALLIELADGGSYIEYDNDGKKLKYKIGESEFANLEPLETAKASCKALTSFVGKEGTVIDGIESVKALKGKRLEISTKNARTLVEKWRQ